MKVAVTGPESSGSKLVARIAAHVLNVCDYDAWDGYGWAKRKGCSILHRSNPYNNSLAFKLGQLGSYNKENTFLVVTSRDKSCSFLSRKKDVPSYSVEKQMKWVEENKKVIQEAQRVGLPYFIFSYETLILFRELYLQEFYHFLGVKSSFCPDDLVDQNEKYIKGEM